LVKRARDPVCNCGRHDECAGASADNDGVTHPDTDDTGTYSRADGPGHPDRAATRRAAPAANPETETDAHT